MKNQYDIYQDPQIFLLGTDLGNPSGGHSFSSASQMKELMVEYKKKVMKSFKEQYGDDAPKHNARFKDTFGPICNALHKSFGYDSMSYYTYSSDNPELILLSVYIGDNLTPHFIYFDSVLKEEKF